MKEWLPKMKENFREWVNHWCFTQMIDRPDESVIKGTRQVRLISTNKSLSYTSLRKGTTCWWSVTKQKIGLLGPTTTYASLHLLWHYRPFYWKYSEVSLRSYNISFITVTMRAERKEEAEQITWQRPVLNINYTNVGMSGKTLGRGNDQAGKHWEHWRSYRKTQGRNWLAIEKHWE